MNRVISGDMQEKTSMASSGVKGLATVRVDEISMSAIYAPGGSSAICETHLVDIAIAILPLMQF
ncbi:hypothetical protein A6U88_03535 [Agrobacterium sp. B131/95]|nr:hypothetical protein A6U88_03535 [Agrobacterium sp. B131/95]